MDLMPQAKTYPKGGNLFGFSQKGGGDSFNKIVEIQTSDFAATGVSPANIPITIKFDNWAEIDVYFRVSNANGPGTGYMTERDFVVIGLPDQGVGARFLYGTSGQALLIESTGGPNNNPTVRITANTQVVIGAVQIIKRLRKVKNFASFIPVAGALNTIPFNISDPTKTWMTGSTSTNNTNINRIGAFINSYFDQSNVRMWHMVGTNDPTIDGVKIVSPSTLFAGTAVTPQIVNLIEFF